MSYRVKVGLIAAFFVILAGLGIYRFLFGGQPVVPAEFAQARIEGARVADIIANLSSVSLGKLEIINKYDREKNYQAALVIVEEESRRNRQARAEAVKLSVYLDQMAKALPEIKPRRARDWATEAVGKAINLIIHLIARNEFLQQLLESLQVKFRNGSSAGSEPAGNGAEIKALINKINEETIAINRLNKQFNDLMERFDALTLGGD